MLAEATGVCPRCKATTRADSPWTYVRYDGDWCNTLRTTNDFVQQELSHNDEVCYLAQFTCSKPFGNWFTPLSCANGLPKLRSTCEPAVFCPGHHQELYASHLEPWPFGDLEWLCAATWLCI